MIKTMALWKFAALMLGVIFISVAAERLFPGERAWVWVCGFICGYICGIWAELRYPEKD